VAGSAGAGVEPQHRHLVGRNPALADSSAVQRKCPYLNMINKQLQQRVAEIIGADCGDQNDVVTGAGGQQGC
jgi:hypothetical protein